MFRQRFFNYPAAMVVFVSISALFLSGGPSAFAQDSPEFEIGETIYENPLNSPEDVEDWVAECAQEGRPIRISSPENEDMLRLYSEKEHFLFWCPEDFPDNIAVSWDFLPIERVDERGLAMFWMAATGENGKDLFHPSLDEREGHYKQYTDGDINAMHFSYYRRNTYNQEARFHKCVLRKAIANKGSPRVARAGDPMADTTNAEKPYRIQVIKYGPYFRISIKDRHGAHKGFMKVLEWKDDGEKGSIFEGGKIGFRQMRGLIADYSNLKVQRVTKDSDR